MGTMIDRRRVYGGSNRFIQFADPAVKAICVEQWGGADGGIAAANTRVNNVKVKGTEGEITYEQAASVKSIAKGVFSGNTEIVSFDEYQYFNSMTSAYFKNCSNLESITLPTKVTSIGFEGFSGCSKVVITNIGQVTSLSRNALYGCSNITWVDSERLISIAHNCMSLTGITFLRFTGNMYLGDGNGCAVGDMPQLQYLILSNEQTNRIGSYAGNMGSLRAVVFQGTTIVRLADGRMPKRSTCSYYVPDEVIDDWKADSTWSSYINYIKPLSEYDGPWHYEDMLTNE